jgi:hypothetical protein
MDHLTRKVAVFFSFDKGKTISKMAGGGGWIFNKKERKIKSC